MKNFLKAALLLSIMLLASASGLRAQNVVQVQIVQGYFNDVTNPTAKFLANDTKGNVIVALAGCRTALDICNTSIPTDTEGNTFTLAAVCTAVTGSKERTLVYTAFNIAGGTADSVHTVGTNLQFLILELHGVNAVDQSVCSSGTLPGGGMATSGTITTKHPVELVLGLGSAACLAMYGCSESDFSSVGSGWNLGAYLIGSQVSEYQILAAPQTIAATAGVSSGTGESYALAVISFYQNTTTTH